MKAVIGMGSNLGDRFGYLQEATNDLFSLPQSSNFQLSSVYQTSAIGRKKGPPYLNACLIFKTLLKPTILLQALLTIEKKNGRKRPYPNAPRTLDLDLLLWESHVISCENLIIPHPRMQERLFVLIPLSEIDSKLIHPVFKKDIFTLKNILLAQSGEEQFIFKTDLKL